MKNKDDERLRKTTIAFLKDFAEKGYENAVECIDWLEKQGELKSAEWSDEDEKYLKLAIDNFQTLGNSFLTTWLKSFKDRCTWKASRKQMKDLAFVADQNKGNMVGKTMISLYKDLKKLK